MRKNFLVLMLMLLGIGSAYAHKVETLASPSGNIKLEVTIGNRLTYSVFYGEEQILKDCPISLQVGAETFGTKPRLSSAKRSKVDEVIRPVVPLKYAQVPNHANQLTLAFKGGISLYRDDHHLGLDYGRYLAGLVWYRFFTGKSAETVTFAPEGTDPAIIAKLKSLVG